jgi:hypothetical protein
MWPPVFTTKLASMGLLGSMVDAKKNGRVNDAARLTQTWSVFA